MRLGTTLPILLSIVLTIAPAARSQTISNPEIYAKSADAARQALEFYGAYDDREQLSRVADLGYRIAAETRFKDYPFSFFLVDIPVPNAFALPGGQIFLTRGMLDLEPTDDMLAGLLGHEIGHVVFNHGMRMQRRAALLNALSQALLAGVVLASDNRRDDYVPPGGYDPSNPTTDRIMGTAAAGAVVSELLLRNYSREFEDEADDEGQRFAAGAGFDPDGYRQLMELMRTRLPETQEYGYWRTHPFFESRVKAATVRAELLAIGEAKPVADYRRRTQAVLLSFDEWPKALDPESERPRRTRGRDDPLDMQRFIETAALTAWPQGPAADRIRLAGLHEQREEVTAQNLLSRDFGALLEAYQKTHDEVATFDPDGDLLTTLDEEMAEFRGELAKIYPKAVEIFEGGIYETEFLEVFLNNFPENPHYARAALKLGNAYARSRRPEAAAEMYQKAWESAPDSEHGSRARTGLLALAPNIDRLSVLQRLTTQQQDDDLSRLAQERLQSESSTFGELDNGAEFLKQFPDHSLAAVVSQRIDDLAEALLVEATLYQRVGDHAKALENIHQILTGAPFSPAAERLRKKVVIES